MKKLLLFVLLLVFSVNTSVAQDNPQKDKKNIFKEFYNDFLKYGTFYAAGDIRNAYENSRKDDVDIVESLKKIINQVSENIETFQFNKSVAKIYEFVNILNEAKQNIKDQIFELYDLNTNYFQ